MKIKYVEELVGISRKNIRFYEEQGLLAPGRAENGYREYGQDDIERLMQIKLFRKLGVSIENIKNIFQGSIRLEDCLDAHLDELERQKENLTKMQAVSSQIILNHARLSTLDTESYLDMVEKFEKEGSSFMDMEKSDIHRKKKLGTLLAGMIVILITLAPVGILLWVNTIDPVPIAVIAVFAVLHVLTAAAVIAVIAQRIKEIKGGEEDEAVKY